MSCVDGIDPGTDSVLDQIAPAPAEAATELGADMRLSDGSSPGDEWDWLYRLMGAAALVALSLSVAFPCGLHAC